MESSGPRRYGHAGEHPEHRTPEGKPEATAAEQDGLMAQRMSAALAEAEILATRKAEAESGSTADAQSWLRSRSERRALLDLAIMIFEMQENSKRDNRGKDR